MFNKKNQLLSSLGVNYSWKLHNQSKTMSQNFGIIVIIVIN